MEQGLIGFNPGSTCHLITMKSTAGPGLNKNVKTILIIIAVYAVAFVLATF
jgi:hypothetical protein